MIHPGIRHLAIVAVLCVPFGHGASAQLAKPSLRERVVVTSDVVRIGDLVENAGPVADIPIFRAPDLGTTGAVSVDRVVEAIRPHQLIDIDTHDLAAVVVTRFSRAISPQDVSSRIAQLLSAQCHFGDADALSISFDREVKTLQVEPDATGPLQAVGLSCDPQSARFDVTFDLAGSAEMHRHPQRFTGTAIETVAAVTVSHPVERGDILKASDLIELRRPKSEGSDIAIVADAVGLAARHELRPDVPLHVADLAKPNVVQRNDTVTIVYQAPGLILTLRGQAQEAGALGDSIGVLNAESKRVVQAVVSGPGRVTVTALTTRLVENTSPMVMSPAAAPQQSE